jgi:hypothetical protein
MQVKKCEAEDCWYCVLNPPRLSADKFAGLHWLPDPVIDPRTDEYRPFEEVYGTETTDQDRPSLKQNTSTPTENDKKHKGDLVAGSLFQHFIFCINKTFLISCTISPN